MRYHDTRSFIGEYIKFNRKNITQKEFVYKERHYKQKNHTKNLYIYIYIFYLSEAFFHAKQLKHFFTKNLYITLAFLLEIYKKKHIDYLGNIYIKINW